MENDKLAGQEAMAEFTEEDEEREYELEGMDTEDLDDAMREALEAVERSEEHLEEVIPRDDEAASLEGGDLAVLQAELAELRDRSVRTLADFDNYRKRVARERSEERRYAAADLANDILAVVDNLERALESEGSVEDLKQGVAMVNQQLQSTLGRHGVHRVAALDQPFDPSVHEAVMRIEDTEIDRPMVSEEMQSGYTLHGRLLRPSMVKVAVPVENEVPAADEPQPEEPAED